MASRFALVVANTEYTDPGLAQLTAPGRDAREFGRVLDSPDLCAFDDVIILFNETATKVSETIDYFFSLRKPDDLLILYFSGHGVRDEYGSLYLAVKNSNRARLRSTAIKADFIREAMDQSRSKRQILILDCCNSGAFAEGTKGATGGSIGTAKAFEGTGYGRIVLTASDSTQFAWEGDKVIGEEITNSLFTHFLVKGLEGDADRNSDGKISVDELYDYAYEQVIRRTPKQTPGKWSYRQQGELFLRENLKARDVRPALLPADLLELAAHQNTGVRRVAVQELVTLLDGKHLGMVRSAQEKLQEIAATDDSLTLRQMAVAALSTRGLEAGPSAAVDIQTEESTQEISAKQSMPAPALAALSLLGQRLKTLNPLPRLMKWKLAPRNLDKRLMIGVVSAVLGIALLAGARQFLFNNWSIFGATPTPSPTFTRLTTATLRPTLTITSVMSETRAITPTLTPTRTRTATPTLTATPTSTKTPLPTFTMKPTRRPRDTAVPPP
jgi:hypothetical protein